MSPPTAGAALAAAAPLRALPVPQCEPHPLGAAGRALLEQVHPAQQELSLVAEAPAYRARRQQAVGARWAGRPGDEDDDELLRRTPAALLPDPAPLVTAVVSTAIEVLAGTRPPAQLLRWLSAEVYASLQRRASVAARLRRRSAPVRRATVRRVLTTSPAEGVVEASVVVQDARRVRAVAVRLEGWDGRWRVTALEVG